MKHDEVFVKHILEEVDFILEKSKNLEYEVLLRDETLKRAFLRSLEVIGEAAKNVSPDFAKTHSEIEWRALAGLRDKLIHQYFGVKLDIVWDVIKNKLPRLKEQIENIGRSYGV
ncbi:MAG: DUF86 domain-containing protein [Candidatus Eisenbacteria bacterium]|nr:DUF86 domain-containing protein [Candidatus Eisenbacteria bacterium]